jgi:hypothetical protein
MTFSGVLAENKIRSNERGWGLAVDALLLPSPNFKYESTSVGDISYGCRAYEGSLSAFFFGKGNLFRWRPLWQGEFGLSWLSESGHKDLTLQGYPATAENDLKEIGLRLSLIANYLKMKRIWVGSGLETCAFGKVNDDFSITVRRDGRDIEVFSPGKVGNLGHGVGLILISAKIFDRMWNSWELQFGYWNTTVERSNSYGSYGRRGSPGRTRVNGWYFKIRKLFLFELRE